MSINVSIFLVIVCFKGLNALEWVPHEGNLYARSTSKTVWMNAQKICQEHNSSLVSIDDHQEQTFVVDNLLHSRGIWTSGSDRNKEGSWAWYSGYKPMSNTNWKFKSGVPYSTKKNCLKIRRDGKWTHEKCSKPMYFVCEIQNKESFCDKGGIWKRDFQNGKCYHKIESMVDWTSALHACQERSANLISIESPSEQKYINDHFPGESFWTSGIYDNKQGDWIFASGTKSWSYTNWSQDKPDNGSRNKRCLVAKSTGWHGSSCNHGYKALCEKPLLVVPVQPPTDDPHVDPPYG